MLEIRPLGIPDVLEVRTKRFVDARGFLSETFSRARFREVGVDVDWVQDNHSLSSDRFTLRGLHYQEPPVAQAKLVRVIRGRIFDVAVDIRRGSPYFAKWVCLELSPDSFNQILVPVGFAHGFLTLEPDTEVLYKVSAPYSGACDRSIRWNDSMLAIEWPLNGQEPSLSEKDRDAPLTAEVEFPFTYTPDPAVPSRG